MELKHCLMLLRRWALFLLIGLIIGALGGYLGSMLMSPMFEAATKVMVTRSQQENNSDFAYLSSQQFVLTYIQLLTTPQIINTVSERLNTEITPEDLLKKINIQQIRDTQIIEIRVEDTDPNRAMAIANLLVQVLIEENITLQTGRYDVVKTSLETQIAQVEKQITALHGDFNKLSKENLQSQIAKAQEQIQIQQKELTSLEQEIAALMAQSKIPTPYIQAQINEKRSRLSQIQAIFASYQDLYSNLIVLGQAASGNAVQNDPNLTQIQTTLTMYQQLYTNLLNNLESVNLERLQNTPDVDQIVPATLPKKPIYPKPLLYTLLAGTVGLMLTTGIVFLLEYLDDTIKTPEDIKDLLGLPVLGYVSEGSTAKFKHGKLSFADQPFSPFTEAFRSLRTNLEFAAKAQLLHTIMITSAGSGDGKSTVVSNLAASFSQTGRSVLLLDADLRCPAVHRFFDLDNRAGLTDVFRERLDLSSVTQVIEDNSNFLIVTSGSLPVNPTELLASPKMTVILSELKQLADLVILDTAPAIFADAQALSAKVDGVLLVVCPGRTRKDELCATVEQFKRAEAHVLGVVFNRIPQNRFSHSGDHKLRHQHQRYQPLPTQPPGFVEENIL